MLFEVGYPVPSDIRVPDNWRLSHMGKSVPLFQPARIG